MASISLHSPISPGNNPFPANRSCCFVSSKTNFFGSTLPVKPLSFSSHQKTANLRTDLVVTAATHSFDVVIVGAGIIGLTIARQFLLESDLSVAVVDKAIPCSGATGAGQGYLWLVHKTPGSDNWDLAIRSHKLWNLLAESLRHQGLDPLEELGWKKTGSLLVGRAQEDSVRLKSRVEQLSEAGLRAEYLCSRDLHLKEPELAVGEEGGAAFLLDDCQLDAQRAVAFILKTNRSFASKERYAEFFNDPVTGLLRSGSDGVVEGVWTTKNTLYSKKAVVVAAGCWSGSLLHNLVRDYSNIGLDVPVKPRKGHLLVLEHFNSLELNHGLMEVGYVDHLPGTTEHKDAVQVLSDHGQALSISMAATRDSVGNLVLGSSRQFAGFSTEVDESIIKHIWMRAGEFFPKLQALSLQDFITSRKVRVGLRPYMPDGKPMIGPVPSLMNLFIATGHEGGGLSMKWLLIWYWETMELLVLLHFQFRVDPVDVMYVNQGNTGRFKRLKIN